MMLRHITLEQLKRLERQGDALAEDAGEEVVLKLRRFLTRYVNNFKAVLNDTRADGLEDSIINLAEQQRLVDTITELLDESGYGEVVDEFEESLRRVGEEGIRYFREAFESIPTFGGVNQESIRIMAESFLDELDFQIDNKLIRPLEAQVRDSILTLKTRGEAVDDITRAINEEQILRKDGKEFTQVQIETLVHESNRRFMQHVRNEKADQLGLELFIYSGPLDKVTSDQCRFLLGTTPNGAPAVFYKDQITSSLHPKLPPNPLVSRGHFNCRHEWLPVTEDFAVEQYPGFRPRGIEEQAEAA